MKPLVIYHDNCADGFGAAFAAWMKFGEEAEYFADTYGKKDAPWRQDENLDMRDVYIVDFSYSREDMEYLFAYARQVVWLDHHKTAFEMWCGEYYRGIECIENNTIPDGSGLSNYICLNDNKSGALLAWEYFHPTEQVPMFIKHLDDYDRWQFNIPGTKALNAAMRSYQPWNFYQWRYWNSTLEYGSGHILMKEGEAILRAHDANVQAIVDRAAMRCVITDYDSYNEEADSHVVFRGLAANCPSHMASDVGHELANQSGTYGLLWHINKEGKCLCSLRSNGDYDVSAIAKAFGGGGHRNAAGFEVDIQTLLSWLVR